MFLWLDGTALMGILVLLGVIFEQAMQLSTCAAHDMLCRFGQAFINIIF